MRYMKFTLKKYKNRMIQVIELTDNPMIKTIIFELIQTENLPIIYLIR